VFAGSGEDDVLGDPVVVPSLAKEVGEFDGGGGAVGEGDVDGEVVAIEADAGGGGGGGGAKEVGDVTAVGGGDAGVGDGGEACVGPGGIAEDGGGGGGVDAGVGDHGGGLGRRSGPAGGAVGEPHVGADPRLEGVAAFVSGGIGGELIAVDGGEAEGVDGGRGDFAGGIDDFDPLIGTGGAVPGEEVGSESVFGAEGAGDGANEDAGGDR